MSNVSSLIHRTLSGDNAQAITAAICEFYRSPGAAGYHAATNLVADRLREYNIENLEVTTYPLDGETKLAHRTMPLAWEPYSAAVRIVNPTQEEVVNYNTAPSCLAWWSQPTPVGGLTAELVDVGTGETDVDFAGKNLAGKIAFISGTERPAGWSYAAVQAMQRGAKGLLTDYLFYPFEPDRTRENLPDAVQLLRLPNQKGKFDAWACSIDYPAAQRLRHLLRLGPVTLHADIDCRLFEGYGQNLLATIPGRELPEESVFFIAHTSAGTRPGANCAAGPALMVEIARTLNHLIQQGQIRRPRRSIKFLIIAEGLGSAAYIDANRDELPRIKTAFCFDSVGHDQGKLKSTLLFYRHPDSSPSFINDYFAGVMERSPKDGTWVFADDNDISPVQFTQAPYTPWSDNHYWAAYGVPSPLIMSWPDLYFHTQLLTPHNTDPRVFRRVGVTTALAAYEIADAGLPEALAIADEVASRGLFRLESLVNEAVEKILDTARAPNGATDPEAVAQRAHRELAYYADRDAQAIASALSLIPDEVPADARNRVKSHSETLERKQDQLTTRLHNTLATVRNGGTA